MSSRCSRRMSNVESNVVRVAMPSAKVSAVALVTLVPLRHDWAKASAPAAWTPMTRARLPNPRPHQRAAARAAAAADRHEHDVGIRQGLEQFEGVSSDAGNEQRLVGRMHVAQAPLADDALDVLAGLVEVLADFDNRRTICPHRGVLVRIVSLGNDHCAGHVLALTGHGDRLPVITRAGGQHTPPLLGTQGPNQVEAATDLEGVGWVVVLVLDEDVQAGGLVEERMLQQRRRPERAVDDAARRVDVAE